MTSPSTSLPSTGGGGAFRTDKKALLAALAEELKREKLRAEQAAQRMVEVESQVEQKHREFLDEEASLSAQRDANASTIAALRKTLAKARQALDEANHVEDDEADAYLSLLSNGGGTALSGEGSRVAPLRDTEDDERPQASPTLPHHAPFLSSSPIASSQALPLQQPSLSGPPPPAGRPTSQFVGHPFQTSSPFPTAVATAHGNGAFAGNLLERSIWHDSLDEPHPAQQVNPDLAKNGGRWSKVFPSLRRRSSSRQRE
ncbi:hypothetical protein JCM10213_001059 [Rhodosporidiobolus nylandii]